jgi:hypothetical protein
VSKRENSDPSFVYIISMNLVQQFSEHGDLGNATLAAKMLINACACEGLAVGA